jgi:hypothetical protein
MVGLTHEEKPGPRLTGSGLSWTPPRATGASRPHCRRWRASAIWQFDPVNRHYKRAPLRRGVGQAVFMHEPPVGIGTHHVDIGASSQIVRVPRAYLEIYGHRRRPVDQVMAVACAFRKSSAIARVQCSLAAFFDEYQLALRADKRTRLRGCASGADWTSHQAATSSDSRRNREGHPHCPGAAVYAQHRVHRMARDSLNPFVKVRNWGLFWACTVPRHECFRSRYTRNPTAP